MRSRLWVTALLIMDLPHMCNSFMSRLSPRVIVGPAITRGGPTLRLRANEQESVDIQARNLFSSLHRVVHEKPRRPQSCLEAAERVNSLMSLAGKVPTPKERTILIAAWGSRSAAQEGSSGTGRG